MASGFRCFSCRAVARLNFESIILKAHLVMQQKLEIRLMNALEAEPRHSQRRPSVAYNVSLGTVHFCFNALIENGFFKAQNFRNSENKQAYACALTPSGINHKQKINIAFLKRKKREFDTLTKEIALLENDLKQTERQG